MRFMLSFTRGTPIGFALDKNGDKKFTIHITKEQKEPDIAVDHPLELITKHDIVSLGMKFGALEIKMIQRAIKPDIDREKLHLTEKLKRAIEILEDMAEDKLKHEINMEDDPDIDRVVPCIGVEVWDRPIAIIGCSGSGKSFLAKEIIALDQKKRPVVLFSKVHDDESLAPLKKLKTDVDGESRLIKIPLVTEGDFLDLPSHHELKNTICMFDDIATFDVEKANYLLAFQNDLLETGRHDSICCICTNHVLNDRIRTIKLLNEAQLVILFPASNRFSSNNFLRNRFGMNKKISDMLIDKAMDSGRFMGVRLQAPNLMIHNKGVILL